VRHAVAVFGVETARGCPFAWRQVAEPARKGPTSMLYRIVSAPARPVRRALATIMASSMLVATASAALAQQQQQPQQQRPQAQPAQRPQAQPAQPARPQQQPQRPAQTGPQQQPQQAQQGEQPQLIYSPWTKFCLKEQSGKQVCFTGKDARIESGMPVASAALIEPEGEPKKLLRINVPLAMKIEHGTRLIIDQTSPRTAPYVSCFVTGCVSDYEVNVDTVNQLKKSQQLHIQAIGINGQPFTVPLPLAEFAKAYDGPPTDPKVMEEQQKKLQDELQRRAEDARKRLESQQSQTPTR
jgi:invasion protein IalB